MLPLEIIAASLTIEYWNNSLPRSVFVTMFLVVILTINMFGVKGYGEAEYIFSMVKVIAIIGFMYVSIPQPYRAPVPVPCSDIPTAFSPL